MVAAAYDSVRGISFSPTESGDTMLPVLAKRQVYMAVSSDAINGYVYFFESSQSVIQRRRINSTGNEALMINQSMLQYLVASNYEEDKITIAFIVEEN